MGGYHIAGIQGQANKEIILQIFSFWYKEEKLGALLFNYLYLEKKHIFGALTQRIPILTGLLPLCVTYYNLKFGCGSFALLGKP